MTRSNALVARTAAIAGVLALALTAPGAKQADAQSARVCLPQATSLVDQLGREYGEVLTAAGVDAAGNLVQIYSSDDRGTWTIVVTVPGGPTCVVSSGEGWVREQAEMPKPGNPA
ncbi:MAG: hypothetical protein RLO51_18805 [Thalassobaculum sp.]|uniref:hypothetical protein n=1 Tax=Thalassobaculum sp. TaxID=2022740 RepID=UPI0032EFC946